MHAQVGVLLLQLCNGFRQDEARLGMRGGQREFAVGFFTQIGGQRTDIACLVQDAARPFQYLSASGRDRIQALAAPGKHLKAQLAFELLELLADA